jgi:formylglycine-generating enzyme required for sulfatase activity
MKRYESSVRNLLALQLTVALTVLSTLCFFPAVTASVLASQGKGGTIKPAPTPKATPRPVTRATPTPPTRRKGAGSADSYIETINKVPLEMVLIPAGTFLMGSPDGEGKTDEHPQHQVTVRSFYIGRFEVTQAQYKAVMKEFDFYRGDDFPVHCSWDDAAEFCRRLSRLTGREYRLPSEAEWEYAARAGTTTPYFWGEDFRPACQYANVADQSAKEAHADWAVIDCRDGYPEFAPVGKFRPNGFGLYDMTGNVWEWCEDWYHQDYREAPTDGSAWVWSPDGSPLKERVLRGAGWGGASYDIRSAARFKRDPGQHWDNNGFRVVAVARK